MAGPEGRAKKLKKPAPQNPHPPYQPVSCERAGVEAATSANRVADSSFLGYEFMFFSSRGRVSKIIRRVFANFNRTDGGSVLFGVAAPRGPTPIARTLRI